MGRPPFTRPTERPKDTAALTGNLEEFSQFDQTVTTDTVYNTVTEMTVGTDTNVTPVYVESVSIAYHGGITASDDIQWRLLIDDENDNQDWLKYGGSGGDSDGPVNLPGVRADDGFDIRIQVRNQTGAGVNLSTAINYRTE